MKRFMAIGLSFLLMLSLSACDQVEKIADVVTAISEDKAGEMTDEKETKMSDSSLKVKKLQTDKSTYREGEGIIMTIEFEDEEEHTDAWAGIIESDAVEHGDEVENDNFDLEYIYLSNIQENKYTFEVNLSPGSYDIRVFDSDSGGVEVAYVTFEVIGSEDTEEPEAKSEKKGNFGEGERTMNLWSTTLNPSEHPIRTVSKMVVDGVTTTTTMGMDYTNEEEPKMYLDIDTDGEKMTMLLMDNKMYSIMHSEKMVLVMQQDEEYLDDTDISEYEDDILSEDVSWSSGTEEFRGEQMDYEEMTDSEGNSTRFYYEKGSNKLRYLVSNSGGYVVEQEYLEYDNKVPGEWFELPEDYTLFDMS